MTLELVKDATMPPEDIDAEMGVLTYLLNRNECVFELNGLKESHFSDPFLASVFSEIVAQVQEGKRSTPVTLKNVADTHDKRKILANIMGVVYQLPKLHQLVQAVRQAAQRRDIYYAAQQLLTQLEDGLPEDIAANGMQMMEAVISGDSTSKFQDCYEIGTLIYEEMKEQHAISSTGIPKLDEAMGGGLHRGFTYGFAARKKVGKTVLASTISHNLNMGGVRHVLICGEMGPKQIYQRTLARHLEVDPACFRLDAKDNPAFQKRVADAVLEIPRNAIFRNAPGLTFDQLRQIMVEAVFVLKVEGIILDYWQLVGGKPGRKSTAEHLDEVAQWMADFGRKHNVWNLITGQVNQDGNTRGGEGLRLACDQCYQMHREDLSQPGLWMEMMDTRYTQWLNIGSPEFPGLIMHGQGPWIGQAY